MKKARRALLPLLILALTLALGVTALAADNVVASGDCGAEGANVKWTLTDDGTLTISGKGKMADWDYGGSPWYDAGESIKAVVIQSGVTSIGEYAFSECTSLTSVTIPSSVTNIGECAFYGCSSLIRMTIPGNVKTIGNSAFADCKYLKNIIIQNGVKTIGNSAFYGTKLKSVSVPASVTEIGASAFSSFSLTAITVDNGNASYCSMDGVLFNKTKTTLVEFPTGKSGAYSVPAGVKTIGTYAFYRCYSLTDITLPSSVTVIGDVAFYQCSLTDITLPSSVTVIGDSAFYQCDSLTDITLPSSVTVIGDSAFYCCSNLKDITLSPGLRSIGEKAFSSCHSLSKLTVPATVTEIGGGAFEDCSQLTIYGEKGSYVESYCDDYDIPFNVVPTAPTSVKLSNANTGIKVTWTKVNGAAKYRVFYKPEGGSWTKAGDTTSTNYTWTKAKSGTTYQIRVRCITSDGKTGTSDFSAAKTIKYIAAPKDVKVSSTSTGIKITWTKSAGAAKYRIYYKTGSGSWKTLTHTTSNSYTWTGAKNGTKYTFRVRCATGDGKSVTSGYTADKSITYKKTSTYKYEAPTGVKVSNEKTGIKVTWTKVSGAAKYRVFYKPEGGSWTKAGDTTATSYSWTKAKSGTTYQIRVRCITSDGKTGTSDFSAAKSIKYIAAPKDVKVSNASNGIKITWTKSTGAAKYRIYYKTGSGSWKTLTHTTSNSYTWTGAKNGVKYTFRVRCATGDAKSVTSGYTADKTITYKK